jgi:hypothetical protein
MPLINYIEETGLIGQTSLKNPAFMKENRPITISPFTLPCFPIDSIKEFKFFLDSKSFISFNFPILK